MCVLRVSPCESIIYVDRGAAKIEGFASFSLSSLHFPSWDGSYYSVDQQMIFGDKNKSTCTSVIGFRLM